MKRRDRKRLEAFVRARTDELVDPRLKSSQAALLALTTLMRKEATKDADWDWIEAAAEGTFDWLGDGGGADWADGVLGESIFGDDPESQATALTTAIHQAMALAYVDHPDYDRAWQPRQRR